nr:atherin-like [Microcebus murinus]
MFLPDGSLDLARVDTSLRIEDLRDNGKGGRQRPPQRARWGPAAASSPPPPAPSCQLQPQRGPSPGPAEDPRGPRSGRPPPAVPRSATPAAHRPRFRGRGVQPVFSTLAMSTSSHRSRRWRAAVRRQPGQPCVRRRAPPRPMAHWRPLPADGRSAAQHPAAPDEAPEALRNPPNDPRLEGMPDRMLLQR